jgi:hypothetical protein
VPEIRSPQAARTYSWVLAGQSQYQRAELGHQRRTATPVRVCPMVSHQVPMPAQQGRGLDDQAMPGRAGSRRASPSQHHPVGPVQAWSSHLAAKHRDLVAQPEQLGVLGRCASREQREPSQHLAGQQIEQSQGHAPIIAGGWLLRRTCSSAPTTEFLAPTGGDHRECGDRPPVPDDICEPSDDAGHLRPLCSPAYGRGVVSHPVPVTGSHLPFTTPSITCCTVCTTTPLAASAWRKSRKALNSSGEIT